MVGGNEMTKRIRNLCTMALAAGFLLGIHSERLALWRDDDPHPVQIYDIRADTLPPADQLQLRRGIRVGSREELWLILENYLD